VIACLAVLTPVSASAYDEWTGGPRIDAEPDPWKEQAVGLPAYPDGKHYLTVPVQIPGSNLEMFIDEPSLSVGEDGVVRYVMLLRSPSGGENLFYEGIRCMSRQWITYAYGSSAGEWSPLAERGWSPIRDLGVERYRDRLYRYYLCDPAAGIPRREEMLRRMRYGQTNDERYR
jgi:hypothetical protein